MFNFKSSKFQVQSFKNKGFSLIEMLVVIAVFSIILSGLIGIFVSALRSQRYYLASQKLLDQTSYVMEYMSRSIRMAKKQTTDPSMPICLTINFTNYENPLSDDSKIRFIRNVQNDLKCQDFYLINKQIKQKISTGGANFVISNLTSDDIEVTSLKFILSGQNQPPSDYQQPRITIFLEAEIKNINPTPKVKIQTTVSQRDIDIQEF
ncbi:MAG: prepilin-type N-terminal cleavage/methylation domain-containing protein [Candidatus Nealsonbacteria bacterium]